MDVRIHPIRLIVITHGHFDHIGSAGVIREITGAKIAMHGLDKDCLEKSLKPLPKGTTAWGRVLARLLAGMVPAIRITPSAVDIVLGDEGMSLSEYGIAGKENLL